MSEVASELGARTHPREYIDVRRTDVHHRFFHVFQYATADELLTDLERLPLDYHAFSRSSDARWFGYSGWLYWLLYLKGYTQYRSVGGIDDQNVYLQYLTLGYAAQDADPNMRLLSSSSVAIERIQRRFADCDEFGSPATSIGFAEEVLEPITLFVRDPPAEEDTLAIHMKNSANVISARLIDGHHRLFGARLFGVERLGFRMMMEDPAVPEVPSHIEQLSIDDGRLMIRGWTALQISDVQCIEVRAENRTLCRAPIAAKTELDSPIVAAGEYIFAFHVDAHVTSSLLGIDILDVMILVDWMPVAKVCIDIKPGGSLS